MDSIAADPAVRRLTAGTARIMEEYRDVDVQLAFADYSTSLNTPPIGLVDLTRATHEQAERFRALLKEFFSNNMIDDYTRIPGNEERSIAMAAHEAGIQDFLKRLSMDPAASCRQIARAHFDLANVYRTRGDHPKAISSYRNGLARMQSDPRALWRLAQSYQHTQQNMLAIDTLKTLEAVNGTSPDIHAHIAVNHLQLSNQDLALEFFEKALTMDAAYVPSLIGAGAIYGDKSCKYYDLSRSIRYSKRAIEHDPRAEKAYYNLAVGLAVDGKPEEALKYVEAGLNSIPNSRILLKLRPFLVKTPREDG